LISLLLPSRGRPENLKRLADSVNATAVGDVELIVVVDEDDPSEYWGEGNVSVCTVPRQSRMAMYWNMAYQQASGDILMQCSDDIVFHTPGWDIIVRDAFEQYADRIVFVFGDDGDPTHGNYGTHGFVHRTWVETVGYFVPPYFSADYTDTWLNDLADRVGRKRRVPIVTEHMHFTFHKGELDLTHAERLVRLWRDDNTGIYASREHEREADAAKLKAVMS
jgi:glycosyltransferase involved in cell wall biosynthesis